MPIGALLQVPNVLGFSHGCGRPSRGVRAYEALAEIATRSRQGLGEMYLYV